MFPMVADIGEFAAARAVFQREVDRQAASGRGAPARLRIGAMIEVPALLWQLPQLLETADFVSVGTNDLVQFLFASDRGSPRLGDRYDSLSQPVLRALGAIATEAGRVGKSATVCGEMASRPLEALALVACGFRSLSMPPAAVGPVKAMIRGFTSAAPSKRSMRRCRRLSPRSGRRSRPSRTATARRFRLALRRFAFNHLFWLSLSVNAWGSVTKGQAFAPMRHEPAASRVG